jgi:hypothetical protein
MKEVSSKDAQIAFQKKSLRLKHMGREKLSGKRLAMNLACNIRK